MQHVVSRVVTVGFVQEPEVVDIDEGDADRRPLGAGALEHDPELDDEGTMVEQAGEGVARGRVEQLFGLLADPALRGSEGEVQDRAGHDRRGKRDDEHVPLDVGDRGEDRRGIAPHADHGPGFAGLVQQREQGAHDLASVAGRCVDDPCLYQSACSRGKRRCVCLRKPRVCRRLGRAGQPDGAGRVADLQPPHAGVPRECGKESVEPLDACRVCGTSEVARREPVVHERPDDGRITGNGCVDRRGREVQRDQCRLDRGRDADHDEEHAVDNQEEDGANLARGATGQSRGS